MSKKDKLRRRLRNNPKGVKYSEIETLLLRFGFRLSRVTGSHHIFVYGDESSATNVIIPVHGNTVRAIYVKDALTIIDELFPEESDDEPEADGQDE
jgi:predicted RNA binding protein YcfA (HicA-like mRNA interferase family)